MITRSPEPDYMDGVSLPPYPKGWVGGDPSDWLPEYEDEDRWGDDDYEHVHDR